MATKAIFGGKTYIIPGAYSQIKSGIKNPSLSLEFGNALVINTGSEQNYTGGAGINGTLKSGKEALATFDNSRDMQKYVGGGLWWLLANPLFSPGGSAPAGVSSLTYIDASATVPAEIYIPFGAQDDSDSDFVTANNGDIIIQVRAEGPAGNGASVGGVLTRGYGATISEGEVDDSKFILKIWRGTYKGLNTSIIASGVATPYDGIVEADTAPEPIVESPEVSTVQELVDWMEDESGEGFVFNEFFKLKEYNIATGTDEILAADITNGWYIEAEGGTSTFSIGALNDVLDAIADLTFDFILADKFGADARSVNNLAIQDWIINTAKIKPDLYVASGTTTGEWTTSLAVARAYDSQYVTVVHGGVKKIDIGNRAFKSYYSLYKAAALLGREAGIEPQVPLTFKNTGIEGEVDPLTDKRVKAGLNAGVLMTRLDNSGSFEVVKGINSLQSNTYLVNSDGSTHSKQFARIERQLNKELTVNAKNVLLKKPNGANRSTVSIEDVREFVIGYLQSQTVTAGDPDRLLLSFGSVDVTRNQDAYDIVYSFTPNFEVSFLFFTGIAIDPS